MWSVYSQSRRDGTQRRVDLSRGGVGREPAGELSTIGAESDGGGRRNVASAPSVRIASGDAASSTT